MNWKQLFITAGLKSLIPYIILLSSSKQDKRVMVNGTSFIEVEVTSCLSDKAFRIIYDNLLSFENIYSDDVVHTWSQSHVYTVMTHIRAACILPHTDTHL